MNEPFYKCECGEVVERFSDLLDKDRIDRHWHDVKLCLVYDWTCPKCGMMVEKEVKQKIL